jgi:aldose 1-epimerase
MPTIPENPPPDNGGGKKAFYADPSRPPAVLPVNPAGISYALKREPRWVPWQLVDSGTAHLTVGCTLHPQPGWDWTLACTTTYAVGPLGLSVTSAVTNLSDTPAPFGAGWHPYLAIGDAPVEQVHLTIPAGVVVEVDERLLPTATRGVDGTAYDFRTGSAIGGRRLDTAFTDLGADADGRWRVRLEAPGQGPRVLWGERAAFPWVQVFSGKAEADQPRPHGIAIEPMTCPANAFVSGTDLVVLGPDQSWTGSWGIETPS